MEITCREGGMARRAIELGFVIQEDIFRLQGTKNSTWYMQGCFIADAHRIGGNPAAGIESLMEANDWLESESR